MFNNQLFYFFYELSKTPFVAKVSLFLSYPFTYGVLFILIIWSIFFSKRKMFNFSLLFLSTFFAWILSALLKNIVRVNRPFTDLNIIPLYQETSFSFPSQHMAIFTAIAVSMFLIDKRLGYIFSLIAILIGMSRMIIGVHYPVDILGGFLVGLIVSLIFREIYKKI